MSEEKAPLIITMVVDTTGKITTTTNVQKDDLPIVYRALRVIENEIFEQITVPSPAPPAVGKETKK